MLKSSRVVGGVVLLLLSGLTIEVTGTSQSQQTARPSSIESAIERAELTYRQGEQALASGQPEHARRLFDQALDAILTSGFDVRTNPRLEAYYRDLLERIHSKEAARDDQRREVTEPSLLDQLSSLTEAELPAATAGDLQVFGSFDFEFSVAPPVLQYTEYFANGRGRTTMENGLQRSGRYRQMVEKVFKEEGVPLDLIWLAQAESVWRPNALSRAAAKGIWQFIPSTGARFGLDQTAWVDERSQPEKSTRAAARYLRWLNERFAGDWLLTMAAYNSGEARVEDAIARSGYADFWELYKRGVLPQETRNYVPIILSIIIISKNQHRYGFDVKPDPPLSFDTFELPSQTDLKVVSDLLSVPYEVIQELNPELRRGVSPPGQRYTIRLPKGTRRTFELAYARLPEDQRVRKVIIPREEIARGSFRTQLVSYRTRGGDTLSALSRRYGVSVKQLARLNRISVHGTLRKGQTLRVPVKTKSVRGKKGKAAKSPATKSGLAKSRSRLVAARRS